MGKRVNLCARSVVSPDVTLALDELGVPREVAENVGVEIAINPRTLASARRMLEQGRLLAVQRGHRHLPFPRDVRLGDVAWRKLADGDRVIFNRQPSLHKGSLMGHRVRVMPGRTFRINICVTPPYNADFDGDEMNLFCPQSLGARAEVQDLMAVSENILSPNEEASIPACVQDGMVGAWLLTEGSVTFTAERAMQLLFECGMDELPRPSILSPERLWTGHDLVSCCLPRGLCWRGGECLVLDGRLVRGRLDKKALGANRDGLARVCALDFGGEAAVHMITRLQRLCSRWLEKRGLSVGIGDVCCEKRGGLEVAAALKAAANAPSEASAVRRLQRLNERVGRHARSELRGGAMSHLVESGSKGKLQNLTQSAILIGQQIAGGERPRPLPCFGAGGSSLPGARGFIASSYVQGLSAPEYWYAAASGREGVVSTGCSTSTTGYVQRKLMKALEDVKSSWSGAVVDARGDVCSFRYGGDGLDGARVDPGRADREALARDAGVQLPPL